MLRNKLFQIIVIIFFVLTLNGCKISSDTASEITYNETKTIINTPIITPNITPITTPSSTPSTSITTSSITPKKIVTIKSTSTQKPSKSTPRVSKSVNTPRVSCDGDVCRIITD